ncbi:hypothetical protein P7H16_02230 [Paenibacillus larvae]|nr:hypothetical protein [Paenibacillus larvae]MDT2246068.1 hypothetical protein [Paenibacillus larvae]
MRRWYLKHLVIWSSIWNFLLRITPKAQCTLDNFSVIKIGKGMDELRKENYAQQIDLSARYYVNPVSDEKMVIANVNGEAVMKKIRTKINISSLPLIKQIIRLLLLIRRRNWS